LFVCVAHTAPYRSISLPVYFDKTIIAKLHSPIWTP